MKKFNIMSCVALFGLFALCSCGGSKKEDKPAVNTEASVSTPSIEIENELTNTETSVMDLPVEKRLELAKKYGLISEFSEGFASVVLNREDVHLGAVMEENKMVFFIGNKYGVIDEAGNQIVPCIYDDVRSFSDGLAPVELNWKWGFIDKTGKQVIPCVYDDAWEFSDGLAVVRVGDWETGKFGFIDKTGKQVISCVYGDVGYNGFSDGLAAVMLDDKWGFIDKNGKLVIPCVYDWVERFSDGLALVLLNGEYSFIDKTGKVVIPFIYDYVGSFSDGLARVELNGKWGFIDKTGKEVIPCVLEDYRGECISEGMVRVKLNGKYGFMNKKGEQVVPCIYDGDVDFIYDSNYCRFLGGFSKVKLNGKIGVIDKTGAQVIPCVYDSVYRTGVGIFVVMINGVRGGEKKFYYYDMNGDYLGN